MTSLINSLVVKLALTGIEAKVEFIAGEGGGINIRVGSVKDVFAAEPVAAEFQARYGIDTLVCF